MRLLHFSFRILKKETKSSLLYIFYLVLSIMAINVVTNLYLNPTYILRANEALVLCGNTAFKVNMTNTTTIINQADILIDGNMVFIASPYTIWLAVVCVVLLVANAHNYFLYDKHQMMGIMKLSGCGYKEIFTYLITQTFTLLMIALPFGIILGSLGFEIFYYFFCYQIGIPYSFGNCSSTAIIYTFIIVIVLIFYLAIITVGFVSRYEVKELILYKDSLHREQEYQKMLDYSISGMIPLMIVAILFVRIFISYQELDLMAGYSIFSYGFFIGSIIKKCLVPFITQLRKKKYINDKIMLATLSFVNLNMLRLNGLTRLLGGTITCAIYYMGRYFEYKTDFMFFYLMFLIYTILAILAILYQMMMEAKSRTSTLKQLNKLGYTKADITKIIKKEVLITISIVGCIGFMYAGLILHSSLINKYMSVNLIMQYILIYVSLLCLVAMMAYLNYTNIISKQFD